MTCKRTFLSKMVPGILLIFFLALVGGEVWARAGGGRSGGYRGSRTYSMPRTPSPGMSQNPGSAPSPYGSLGGPSRTYSSPYSPTGGSPFWRGLAGGLAGGFLGSLLFGNLGRASGSAWGAGGSGLGFLDIILILALVFFLFRFIRNRKKNLEETNRFTGYTPPPYPKEVSVRSSGSADDQDREAGLTHVRTMDPSFDPDGFKDWVQDLFFKIQAAWGGQDLGPITVYLTPQMMEIFSRDLEEQKKSDRINRLENIAVRSVEITEAWQEEGNDFITVLFYANLLDYVVDKTSGAVISGSKTEPVKFREYWTFMRPVGGGPWKLSAIQQEE